MTIKIGQLNVCVRCGETRLVVALNEEGFPLCKRCHSMSQQPKIHPGDTFVFVN
jgi:hypothetical protein